MALLDLLKAQKQSHLEEAFLSLLDQVLQKRTINQFQWDMIHRYFGENLEGLLEEYLKKESNEADRIAYYFRHLPPGMAYLNRREQEEQRAQDADWAYHIVNVGEEEEKKQTYSEWEYDRLAEGREREEAQKRIMMTQKERDEEDARNYWRM